MSDHGVKHTRVTRPLPREDWHSNPPVEMPIPPEELKTPTFVPRLSFKVEPRMSDRRARGGPVPGRKRRAATNRLPAVG